MDQNHQRQADADSAQAPSDATGDRCKRLPQYGPASPGQQEDAETQRNAVGGQRPPLDGELSPHEEPTQKAKAAVERK